MSRRLLRRAGALLATGARPDRRDGFVNGAAPRLRTAAR
ncbi:hypothetical protein H4W80_001672 [Nonomuraea angiospora]|uniref:Uncharacterized protein n=1 Tax=Nonomuraea angiospora TaxID=46172 RepID=A0ABR9LRY0_9ACTN|nr:hypothetical protein [Nonomuraea angiospora]